MRIPPGMDRVRRPRRNEGVNGAWRCVADAEHRTSAFADAEFLDVAVDAPLPARRACCSTRIRRAPVWRGLPGVGAHGTARAADGRAEHVVLVPDLAEMSVAAKRCGRRSRCNCRWLLCSMSRWPTAGAIRRRAGCRLGQCAGSWRSDGGIVRVRPTATAGFVRVPPIVAVEEGDVASARQFDSPVARRRDAPLRALRTRRTRRSLRAYSSRSAPSVEPSSTTTVRARRGLPARFHRALQKAHTVVAASPR